MKNELFLVEPVNTFYKKDNDYYMHTEYTLQNEEDRVKLNLILDANIVRT